jgi:hypothetical protein
VFFKWELSTLAGQQDHSKRPVDLAGGGAADEKKKPSEWIFVGSIWPRREDPAIMVAEKGASQFEDIFGLVDLSSLNKRLELLTQEHPDAAASGQGKGMCSTGEQLMDGKGSAVTLVIEASCPTIRGHSDTTFMDGCDYLRHQYISWLLALELAADPRRPTQGLIMPCKTTFL